MMTTDQRLPRGATTRRPSGKKMTVSLYRCLTENFPNRTMKTRKRSPTKKWQHRAEEHLHLAFFPRQCEDLDLEWQVPTAAIAMLAPVCRLQALQGPLPALLTLATTVVVVHHGDTAMLRPPSFCDRLDRQLASRRNRRQVGVVFCPLASRENVTHSTGFRKMKKHPVA